MRQGVTNILTSERFTDVSDKSEKLAWTLNDILLPFKVSRDWMEKKGMNCELPQCHYECDNESIYVFDVFPLSHTTTESVGTVSGNPRTNGVRAQRTIQKKNGKECQRLRTYIYVTLTLIFVVLTLFTSYIYYKEVLQVKGEIEQVEKDPLLLPFLEQLSSALIRIETML